MSVATDDRATSPTVGSVLLVGITVILATATGTHLFGLAGGSQSAFATAAVDVSPDDDSVTVTWLANANADRLTVKIRVGDQQRTVGLDAVGDRLVVDGDGVTVNSGSVGHWKKPAIVDGERVTVTVVAVNDGERVVVDEKSSEM